jgi:hypothetical protein
MRYVVEQCGHNAFGVVDTETGEWLSMWTTREKAEELANEWNAEIKPKDTTG